MRFRFVLGLLAFAFLSACSDRATEVECDDAFNKFREIKSKGQPKMVKVVTLDELERERPDFLESCVGVASRENIKCWLSARSEGELKKCR